MFTDVYVHYKYINIFLSNKRRKEMRKMEILEDKYLDVVVLEYMYTVSSHHCEHQPYF